MLCMMTGCGIVIVDSTSDGKGGGSGGEGGSAGSETTSTDSGGTGGSETTSSTETVTETMTETSTETETETEVCDPGPKDCQEGTCFCPRDHVCCDKEINPEMCVGNINGYCCPVDMFCIPKG